MYFIMSIIGTDVTVYSGRDGGRPASNSPQLQQSDSDADFIASWIPEPTGAEQFMTLLLLQRGALGVVTNGVETSSAALEGGLLGNEAIMAMDSPQYLRCRYDLQLG